MKKSALTLRIAGVLICMFLLSVSFNVYNQPAEAVKVNAVYDDVYVVMHVNDDLEPSVIHSMLDELKVVTGVQLSVWVGDNNTGAIWDASARLSRWLQEFKDYKVVLRCDYAFDQKYGHYVYPFWKYNDTATLSQQWYTNWYGNLSSTVSNYSNVVLMVGFNEPYNHFRTKEQAQSVLKMEYETWKNLSSVPFSTEFLMPYGFWALHWDFPLNPSTEEDCVPYWANYSDYIGINLWADNVPPQVGESKGALTRVTEVVEMCKYYSDLLGKPIHVNELPAWDHEILAYLCNETMNSPNIGQVYQLWYWSGQEELHYDGWSYGLYNVNIKTHKVTHAEPSWQIFMDVFNNPPN
ncbi:MAG: hypothetical protein NWF00_04705 [Candidatus Bathyarchaeota archaeon]|nr:hypothetical protein [Candidatus Bathyarchaeota archaeon]